MCKIRGTLILPTNSRVTAIIGHFLLVSNNPLWNWPLVQDSGIHTVYASSQWETALQCDAVPHWVGTYTHWSRLERHWPLRSPKDLTLHGPKQECPRPRLLLLRKPIICICIYICIYIHLYTFTNIRQSIWDNISLCWPLSWSKI